ncbi:MAG: methylated-DNA--[protein]-cysteine S-methyltransferase [Frankiaceae bacterium]|nr:methylated-DNA--[protein]-cysteine S-methyltransferase [Frankiaceae bacterium]
MDLTTLLADLGSPAPAGLVDRVLASTGPADSWVLVDGPAGPLMVAFSDHGISYVLAGADDAELSQQVRARLDRGVRRVQTPPAGLVPALRTGRTRQLRFDLRGRTPFEQEVLAAALRIPRGEVRSYAWVAAAIGRPGAVRAVGSALGRNPVPVVIPCHRVVRSDGQVGDYVWGSELKRTILTAEGLDVEEVERLGAAGVVYTGSDTTHIFCVPTCRDARRTTPAHTVRFRSAAAATAAGYRPCLHCEPIPTAA